MIPLGARLAVERNVSEVILASGIVLPLPDQRYSFSGTVIAIGRAPVDAQVGDEILYSSRCDAFELEDGRLVDIVEANSIIAHL